MGGACTDSEIPQLMMLFYLFRYVESIYPNTLNGSGVKPRFLSWQSTRKTSSGGEFGWGGTSVKR